MYIMFAPKLFIRDVLAAKAQPGGRHYAIPHLPALAFDRVWLQGYVQDQKDGFINVSDLTADGIWVNVQHAMFQQVSRWQVTPTRHPLCGQHFYGCWLVQPVGCL